MQKKIYIHVGAPKTATTFFQTKVFNQLDGVRDNDKEGLQNNAESNKLRALGQKIILNDVDGLSIIELKKHIQDIFDETTEEKILLSEESFLGLWAMGFCNGGNIALLLKKLFPEARILLGIREQYSWLTSLYNYCSGDKEVRKNWNIPEPEKFFFKNPNLTSYKIVRHMYTHVNCWVNWNQHYSKFTSLFGEKNVSVLPYELLSTSSNNAEIILNSFLEQPSYLSSRLKDVVNPSKAKSLFDDEQKNSDFQQYVRNLNHESNMLLDEQLPHLDLKELGYY